MNPVAGKLGRLLEKGFVMGVFVWFVALHRLDSPKSYLYYAYGQDVTFPSLLLIYGLVGLLVLMRLRRFLSICKRNGFLCLLVLLAPLSLLWSVDTYATAINSFKLIGSTIFGLYLVMRYKARELLRLLAATLAVLALMCVFVILIWPDLGIFGSGYHAGNWRGLYFSKHMFGIEMLLGAISFAFLGLMRHAPKAIAWGGTGAFVFLVVMSGSRTAWILLLLLPVVMLLLRGLRGHHMLVLPGILIVLFACAHGVIWLFENYGFILETMGRDPTLTGRLKLWELLVEIGMEHKGLGVGYGAFWLGAGGPSDYSQYIGKILRWDTPLHGHSTVLDLWLQLGFIGVALFGLHLILTFGRGLKMFRLHGDGYTFFALTIFVLLAVDSITDSLLFVGNNAVWVIYVVATSWLLVRTPADFKDSRMGQVAGGRRRPGLRERRLRLGGADG